MSARTRLLPLGVLAAAWAAVTTASCTEINAAADHVAAIEFDTLPYPAVVAGDSLRDSLGRAAPLRAVAFNGSGGVITDPPIQYIALDTGVTIDGNDFLVAQRRSGEVRLVASSASVQSATKKLLVARRPDSVIATGKLRDTLSYVVPDNPGTNTAPPFNVRVITRDTAGGVTATQGWLVSYQAFFGGKAVTPGDTSAVFLVDGTRRTSLDTTSTDGSAGRSVRVRPIGITSQLDSVIVLATVRYQGAAVRGSPVRFVILLRPK